MLLPNHNILPYYFFIRTIRATLKIKIITPPPSCLLPRVSSNELFYRYHTMPKKGKKGVEQRVKGNVKVSLGVRFHPSITSLGIVRFMCN